jgi:hypothetical protein
MRSLMNEGDVTLRMRQFIQAPLLLKLFEQNTAIVVCPLCALSSFILLNFVALALRGSWL